MNIGFDAKRAYHNQTGLGHYSRTLIHSLAEYYPEHQYYLFNPKPSSLFSFGEKNIQEVQPSSFLHKTFSSAWRSSWVKKDLQKLKIDLYHGLSHEIPMDIHQTQIRSVVTIHDLVHERHPEQYSKIDVEIYRKKFRHACKYADHVIAISEQTKRDIIDFYKTPEEKITVCYQSCNPAFSQTVSEEEKARIKKLYNLPEQFFLYVGSIIERKNLLNICKAVFQLKNDLNIPLVVIGNGKEYKQKVKEYISQNGLERDIIFLSESASAKSSSSFQSAADFPAIYQSAIAMIYPSFFEGFGIPVLEALCSRLPVITSNISCLPEAGGDAAYYVNPANADEIAEGMKRIFTDRSLAATMKEKGWQHAQNFTQQKCATAVMGVYQKLF
ncbi:MAG: glycosyltransferase family 4 protein [Bacteroidetes bacterium]|nr:MAG: glycosyltransferase family 4 protein [Bacteroidota bacterium]